MTKRVQLHLTILKSLVWKHFKGRYVTHKLGIVWIFLIPIILSAVINFIFTRVYHIQIPHFGLFVLSAMLPWMFFSHALTESLHSFYQAKQILNQFTIPRYLIPFSCVISHAISFIIAILLIVPIYWIILKSMNLFIFPLLFVVLLQCIFIASCSLLCAMIMLFLRDLEEIINIGLMILFWLTPVFYSLEMIPPKYKIFLWVNPMAIYAIVYRKLLFYQILPKVTEIIYLCVVSSIFLLISLIVFRKYEQEIIKRL